MKYLAVLVSLLLVSPALAQSPITMGDTKIESAGDSGNGNLLVAQQVTLAQPGTLQSISFDVGIAAGQLILGVYSDNNGKPGVLLAQTATFTPIKGWNTKVPTSTPVLQPGTYWLAYAPSSNNLTFFKQNNIGNCFYLNRTFQAMTPTWPLTGITTTQNCTPTTWSFYASVMPFPLTLPVVSAPPVITGTPQVGSTLTASSGIWSDAPTFAYQWFSGTAVIPGATTSSYTAQASDVGNALTAAVTATNAAGSAISASAPTAPVTQPVDFGPDNLVATVVGPTEVDLTWTAVLNAQCYQILRNGTQIGTSAAASYQDTTAVHGTAYTYNVMAVISVESAAASATP